MSEEQLKPEEPKPRVERGKPRLRDVARAAWSARPPSRGVWDQYVYWIIKGTKELGFPIVVAFLAMAMIWALIFRLPGQIKEANAPLAAAIDKVSVVLDGQTKAFSDHLDEDLKDEIADRVAAKLQPYPPEPKPVRVRPLPARRP